MRAILILVAVAGCSDHGESGNHTLVDCDGGQCELACTTQHPDVPNSCTAIYPPEVGSGTEHCETTIAVNGVSGCCIPEGGIPRFWECSLEHTFGDCVPAWAGLASKCETPCRNKPAETGAACVAHVIVQPAPVTCDATFDIGPGRHGCCLVDVFGSETDALLAECE